MLGISVNYAQKQVVNLYSSTQVEIKSDDNAVYSGDLACVTPEGAVLPSRWAN